MTSWFFCCIAAAPTSERSMYLARSLRRTGNAVGPDWRSEMLTTNLGRKGETVNELSNGVVEWQLASGFPHLCSPQARMPAVGPWFLGGSTFQNRRRYVERATLATRCSIRWGSPGSGEPDVLDVGVGGDEGE